MKSDIIRLRKKIYKNLKDKAMSYESFNSELSEYANNQKEYSKRKFKMSDMDSLKERVTDNDVLFIGDFHTFNQNVRTVLRILRYIISQKSECILGLEMVAAEDQVYIDAYIQGHLTDLEFLESVNYHSSWRFPWTHYKLIFELAKEFKLKVVGLNTKGSLIERDEFAAEKLKHIHLENPSTIMLVLYGELHISLNKIPALLKKVCPEINALIIHQNLDEVYWKLIRQNIESGVVSFSSNEYCIVSAPPWIKYESMIYWYENLCDDPEFDIHEYIIENGKKIFSEDTNDNFYNISTMLVEHLKLDIDKNDLEDFNLYDHTNLEYVEEKLGQVLKPSPFQFYNYLISTNKSFRLPKTNTFYCSSYSMNRISYLAGIHILHVFFQRKDIDTDQIIQSKSSVQKFILITLETIVAYFFSKVINPHRKCDLYLDYKKSDDDISKKVIEVIDGNTLSQVLKGVNTNNRFEISVRVGHLFGEYLYLRTQKNISNDFNLKDILEKLKVNKGFFEEMRLKILLDFQYKDHQKRMF